MEEIAIVKTEKKDTNITYICCLLLGSVLFPVGSIAFYKEGKMFETYFMGVFALGSIVCFFKFIFDMADTVIVYKDTIEIRSIFGISKKTILIKDITKVKTKMKQYETVFYHSKGKFTVYHFGNCFEVIDTINNLMRKNKKL